MEYTKGEWEVNKFEYRLEIVSPSEEIVICSLSRYGTFSEANARLIASAPDLYEACKAQHDAIDLLFARLIQLDSSFFPSKSGKPWEAVIQGNEAIAKVESK